VLGRHRALDAFPTPRGVLAHAQPHFLCMLHELVADYDLQRSRSRERAEPLSQGDFPPEPVSASVTRHQVLFDDFFIRGSQGGKPVIHEDCRLDGIRALDEAAAVCGRHGVAPMQARNCWIARWRITRTFASEIPKNPAVSGGVCSL